MQQLNFNVTSSIIKVIALLLALGILFISKYMFIFFVAAMLPSISAVLMDHNDTKCASATICTFNLIGVLPFLMDLVHSSVMDNAAKLIISDIFNWFIIYTIALVGQAVIWIVPEIVAKIYLAKSIIMIASLENKRDLLCTQWGIDKQKLAMDVNVDQL